MIARAMADDVQFFAVSEDRLETSKHVGIQMLLEHIRLFKTTWQGRGEYGKSTHVIKKYVKSYVRGFDGARELREKIMECDSLEEMEKIVGKEGGA